MKETKMTAYKKDIPVIEKIHEFSQPENETTEDWVECRLGEIFHTTSGGTPSRRNKRYYNGTIPWVKSGELDKGIITDTQEKITEKAIKNSSAKLFPVGTLLIALYGATIGKLAFLGVPAATNQAVCGIFKNENYNSKFLFYFLLFKRSYLISQGSGGAQPNISQTILKRLIIPIPPLPIQHALDRKIEALFSSLDDGIADLKKAQEQLKTYRQAVLKKAFEGDWNECNVEDLFDFIGGGTPSKSNPDYWNGTLNWASIKDLGGDYLGKTKDRITNLGLKNSSTKVAQPGEVILATRINPGKSIISNIKTAINQDLKIIKPKIESNNKFVHYLFQSIETDCLNVSSGTTVLGISLKNLKDIKIPEINNIDNQNAIVHEIESRLSVCDAVEENIKESLEKAESLRQSILKKAFSGRLLSEEEISACRNHPDYEPAEKLLEKIRNHD